MRQLLSVSFIFLICLSCRKNNQPEFNEAMNVSVHEDLGFTGDRRITLTFETERSMPCGSALMQGEASVSGNAVTVTITGITSPPNCQYSPRRVARSFDIGKLADGTYNLTINNGKHTSTGSLTVTKQAVGISLSSAENLGVARAGVMRVPAGAIWGNVMYATVAISPVADSFLADIEQKGATPLALPDGEYYYFTIRDGALIVAYNGVNQYLNRKDFLYTYPGVTDSLQPLVSDYSFLHPKANFFIRTWDGRNFNYPGPPVSTL